MSLKIEDYYCTRNDCYVQGTRLEDVEYLIVHSPSVYPAAIRAVSGSNNWYKRWNRPGVEKLVHGFIDDTGVYNFAPYTLACWQIGTSWGNKHCIGYELCELETKTEFGQVWNNAVSHYGALCKKYGLSADRVVGHYEAHEKGFASDHDDPAPYFRRFGKTMADFRRDVRKILDGEEIPAGDGTAIKKIYDPWAHGTVQKLEKGDQLNVRTGPGADYPNLAAWPKLDEGNEVDVLELYENDWTKINIQNIRGYVSGYYLNIAEAKDPAGSYPVWVGKVSGLGGVRLNVRTGPGTSYGLLAAWPKLGEGNLVDVIGESGSFYQVRIAGEHIGYVSRDYLTKE